tara:strand:+ start:934 stop:2481 length:1548 start_codon:yes stop_codon:yes gene_type:complete
MQVIDNTLILRTRNPQKIQSKIPDSDVVRVDEDIYTMAVGWDLSTAQQLARLQMKNIPSPIMRDYEWSGLHAPMTHQKTTAEFLTLNPRAFCFNEQGTGKTGAAIWASDYLLSEGYRQRVLIICPLSIMKSAWQADLFKFAPHRTVGVAHGAKEKRKEIIANDYEYIIINYDGVNVVKDVIAKGGFDLVIIDEANAYKNCTTNRWKLINKLVTLDTWMWMLTGTPAAQSPLDAHGLAKLCVPNNVTPSKMRFKDAVMYPVSKFKWIAKPNAQDIVHKTLQPAIRFTKEQCLDLPEVTYVDREAPLTLQQKHYYKILREEFIMEAGDEHVTSANVAVNMSKLLQLSGGAVYSNSGNIVQFDVSNRLKVVKEVIDEATAKVLIFAPFKHTIDILYQYLNKEGIATEYITGEVSLNKRTKLFDDFQVLPEPRVLVIQPQAAAHGITLTAANTIIWYSPITSTETYLQANARINRKGQKNAMTIVNIEGSAVERKLYRLLSGRLEAHIKLLDLYEEIIQ